MSVKFSELAGKWTSVILYPVPLMIEIESFDIVFFYLGCEALQAWEFGVLFPPLYVRRRSPFLVAVSVSGSSGQACFGYRLLSSFLMD